MLPSFFVWAINLTQDSPLPPETSFTTYTTKIYQGHKTTCIIIDYNHIVFLIPLRLSQINPSPGKTPAIVNF